MSPQHAFLWWLAIAAIAGVLMIAVTSCVSPEQQIADDQAWCVRYGYQVGTEGMADCVSREQQTKYLAHEMVRAGIISSIK